MAFPQDPLPIRSELLINGTWTDVTNDIRNNGDITIERAFRSEQGNTITVDQCDFILNNRTGSYSNRNPLSMYYGLLGRNTQFRVSANVMDNDNALYLYNDYFQSQGAAVTSDKASLDITGDIDIRGDIALDDWTPSEPVVLAAKWNQSSNRSWYVVLSNGGGNTPTLSLVWSTNGTNNLSASASISPPSSGRTAWRITLDVVNGTNKTVTFYTAPTISGTFTQIAQVTTAGTTSIFSSSANIGIGNGTDGVPPTEVFSTVPMSGSYYGFQIFNGIAGTKVADANFAGQTLGVTSWSDGLTSPNTWSVTSQLAIISDSYLRFWGEVFEFPQVWDSTGSDVTVPVSASSLTRRLGRDTSPLASTMNRYWRSKFSIIGQWTMGDASGATTASSAVVGVPDAEITSGVTFDTDTTLASTDGVATLGSEADTITAQSVLAGIPGPTIAGATIFFKYKTVTFVDIPQFAQLSSNGTVAFWTINFDATHIYSNGFDASGNALGSVMTTTHGIDINNWVALRYEVTTSGGNIAVSMRWHQIGDTTVHTLTTSSFCSGTNPGKFTNVFLNPFPTVYPDNNGLAFSDLTLLQESLISDETNFVAAANAYAGELAGVRFNRITSDNNIIAATVGDPTDTKAMGPQFPDTVMNLLQACGDVDNGFIYPSRHFNGLVMRTERSLLSQSYTILDYEDAMFDGSLSPTDDDKILVNIATASRPTGGSVTHEVTSGPNNTSDPTVDPQGVGDYPASQSFNAASNTQLNGLAGFMTYLGTWDEIRLPAFTISLERSIFTSDLMLTNQIKRLDVGMPIRIFNLPTWTIPDPLDVLFRGVTETLQNRGWHFTINTQTYGPYRDQGVVSSVDHTIGIKELPTQDIGLIDNSVGYLSGAHSKLNAGMSSTATSFVVATDANCQPWSFDGGIAHVNLPIYIGGELITISSISSVTGTNPQLQTFTVDVRSANGIVKAHNALDRVTSAYPPRAAF